MLNKVAVRNRRGDELTIPFGDSDSGYGVIDIEGLDPVKATLVSSGFANEDGAQYYSSRREPRQLVLKVDLIADFDNVSVKALRQNLYRFLMPKTEVTLRFYEDLGSYVDIVGRVESFDAPLFSSDPTATITVMCFNPDFFDPVSFTTQGLTVVGSDLTTRKVPYLGSVEAGFVFTMNLDRALNAFSIIQKTPSGDTFSLDFSATLLAGDKLVISTVPGAKGASLTRNTAVTSILWGVSPQAKWLELEGPGDNEIRVSATAAGIPWSIEYVNRHGGL